MAGRVDHEAVLADFEDWLLEDGRPSHGTAHLTRKLAELRARHRVQEDAETRVLRRLGDELVDTLTGLLPVEPATDDPLVDGDPSGTPAAMVEGATTDHTTEGPSWKLQPQYRPQYPPHRVPAMI